MDDHAAGTRRIRGFDPRALVDVASCRRALAAVARARARLDRREIAIVNRLRELEAAAGARADAADGAAADVVAEAAGVGRREAGRVVERANTCTRMPELANAVGDGARAAHVDAVAAALRSLEPAERSVLAGRDQALAQAARVEPIGAFRDTVAREVNAARQTDGVNRLDQQKRAVRARTGIDPASGMWWLHAQLDPESGALINARLAAAIEALRQTAGTAWAPDNPSERHAYLTARALQQLLLGSATIEPENRPAEGDDPLTTVAHQLAAALDSRAAASTVVAPTVVTPTVAPVDTPGDSPRPAPLVGLPGGSRPAMTAPATSRQVPVGPIAHVHLDLSVLIDAETLLAGVHRGTVFDVPGGPFDLPIDTIRRWACSATITAIITAHDNQRLHLGRTARLATREQRLALRALYRGCALCDTAWDRCEVHHLIDYQRGGLTNIDNLLPLCVRHHHLVHEGGWSLALDADRNLTITRPDGTTTVHPPPSARRRAHHAAPTPRTTTRTATTTTTRTATTTTDAAATASDATTTSARVAAAGQSGPP